MKRLPDKAIAARAEMVFFWPHHLDRRLIQFMGLIILLGWFGCNEPLDPSEYSGVSGSYAKVSVRLDSRSDSRQVKSTSRLLNEFGISPPHGTALIIAVPAGTAFSADYNSISGYYDKQLLDLATSTVTLNLPLATSIELFEYVFAESYSLSSLGSAKRFVFSKAVMGPFTLSTSTSTLELQAELKYVLEDAFESLLADGSYDIGYDEFEGNSYFTYEYIDWLTLNTDSYIFNSTSRVFESGVAPRMMYELQNGTWVETTGHTPNATFSHLDRSNLTVHYTNPDFAAKLVGLMDLAAVGFEGDGKSSEEDSGDDSGDGGFMTASDFTPGALGYIFEITGTVDAEYRLDRIAETHDCTNTEFSTLEDFISYHTTREFTCMDYGNGPCLRFQLDATGDTSGDIIEVIRDQNYNIIDQYPAGTWEITTVQTREMLFFYPDSTNYYHDGSYAAFWSVADSKVWEGYYSAGGTPDEPMYVPTFNAAAIEDYRRFLAVAPPETFISGDIDTCGI